MTTLMKDTEVIIKATNEVLKKDFLKALKAFTIEDMMAMTILDETDEEKRAKRAKPKMALHPELESPQVLEVLEKDKISFLL